MRPIEDNRRSYSMYAETKKPGYRYYDLSGRAAEEVRTKTTYVSAVRVRVLFRAVERGAHQSRSRRRTRASQSARSRSATPIPSAKLTLRPSCTRTTGSARRPRRRQEARPKGRSRISGREWVTLPVRQGGSVAEFAKQIAFRDEEIKQFKTMGMIPRESGCCA